jgi:hypothetical protein
LESVISHSRQGLHPRDGVPTSSPTRGARPGEGPAGPRSELFLGGDGMIPLEATRFDQADQNRQA